MSSPKSHRDDQKLLFAVAGVVVAGAVGIAMLAGLASQQESREVTELARDASSPRASQASAPVTEEPSGILPALAHVERDAEPVEPAESLADLGVRDTGTHEPSIEIGPGEDLVAGGLAAYHVRDWPRAAAYFDARVTERPDEGWSHYMLGLARWKAGDADRAAGAMTRAVELDPTSVRARVNLSRIENDRGAYEPALAAAESALEIAPDDPSALFLAARSLYNLGRSEDALVKLEHSRDADPQNGYVHNLFGLIAIERGFAEEAIASLSRAVELEPDVAFIRNNAGMALELGGQPAEALLAYRRAVELDSQNVRAVANLERLKPIVGPMPLEERVEPPVVLASAETGNRSEDEVDTDTAEETAGGTRSESEEGTDGEAERNP